MLDVDVEVPTTGEMRSRITDLDALWTVDTQYNAESFFVRPCYFAGGKTRYRS